ncbi:protein kinase domain-containing protein [Cryptosporidium andersoni]|uniref:Protein kinase domain-containing protein n=1 Tax=Cryptosporidium andersoni TaxID=117008 RepID=A0A1J4MSY4_9CRYT|nr:protein kinase domain-containing protein [Cryptosporidium andersoni]
MCNRSIETEEKKTLVYKTIKSIVLGIISIYWERGGSWEVVSEKITQHIINYLRTDYASDVRQSINYYFESSDRRDFTGDQLNIKMKVDDIASLVMRLYKLQNGHFQKETETSDKVLAESNIIPLRKSEGSRYFEDVSLDTNYENLYIYKRLYVQKKIMNDSTFLSSYIDVGTIADLNMYIRKNISKLMESIYTILDNKKVLSKHYSITDVISEYEYENLSVCNFPFSYYEKLFFEYHIHNEVIFRSDLTEDKVIRNLHAIANKSLSLTRSELLPFFDIYDSSQFNKSEEWVESPLFGNFKSLGSSNIVDVPLNIEDKQISTNSLSFADIVESEQRSQKNRLHRMVNTGYKKPINSVRPINLRYFRDNFNIWEISYRNSLSKDFCLDDFQTVESLLIKKEIEFTDDILMNPNVIYSKVENCNISPEKSESLSLTFEDVVRVIEKRNLIDLIIGNRYLLIHVLSDGTYGKVYSAIDLLFFKWVCLKIMKRGNSDVNYFSDSLLEAEILNELSLNKEVNYMPKYIDTLVSHNHIMIVTELLGPNLLMVQDKHLSYFEEDDAILEAPSVNSYSNIYLNKKIFNEPIKRFYTLGRIQRVIFQLLKCLSIAHGSYIVHCDIKLENIVFDCIDANDITNSCINNFNNCLDLIKDPIYIKLIDWGSSTKLHFEKIECGKTYIQSRYYRSPEICLGLPYDEKTDIWSVGCVMAELWMGRPLFAPAQSTQQLLSNIVLIMGQLSLDMVTKSQFASNLITKDGHLYEKICSNSDFGINKIRVYTRNNSATLESLLDCQETLFIDLLRLLLKLNPSERISASDALMHPWFEIKYVDGL